MPTEVIKDLTLKVKTSVVVWSKKGFLCRFFLIYGTQESCFIPGDAPGHQGAAGHTADQTHRNKGTR